MAHIFAKKYLRNHPNAIEIGPNITEIAKRWVPGTHCCCKVGDARDEARWLKAAALPLVRGNRDKTFLAHVNKLAARQASSSFCVSGVENCDVPANAAIAVHSLYDVTPHQVARAFDSHGLHELVAWMHIPVPLLKKRAPSDIVDPEAEVHWKILYNRNEGKAKERVTNLVMTGDRDPAVAYSHNAYNWKFWFTRAGFSTEFGFNVFIQIDKVWGTQAQITLSRVYGEIDTIAYIPDYATNLIFVPDLINRAANGVSCKYLKTSWVATDRAKFQSVVRFMMSRDYSDITFSKAVMFIRSMARSLFIGNELREKQWDDVLVDNHHLAIIAVAAVEIARFEHMKAQITLDKLDQHLLELREKGRPNFLIRLVKEWFHGLRHELHLQPHSPKRQKLLQQSEPNDIDPVVDALMSVADGVWAVTEVRPQDPVLTHDNDDFMLLPDIDLPRGEAKPRPRQEQPNIEKLDLRPSYELDLFRQDLEQQATAVNEFAQLAEECLEDFPPSAPPLAEVVDRIDFVTGPPGCGKTQYLQSIALDEERTLVIVPTRRLKTELNRKLPRTPVMTTHRGWVHARQLRPDRIILDEAFMFPTGYLMGLLNFAGKLTCLGDPHQIAHIDFTGITYNIHSPVADWYPLCPVKQLEVTHRLPKDITKLLSDKLGYPKLRTTNPVECSIELIGPNKNPDGVHLLTFTQAAKGLYGGITVHEAQGQTFDKVLLKLTSDAEGLLRTSPAHVVVALTRHTEKCFISDTTPDARLAKLLLTPEFEAVLDQSGIVPNSEEFVVDCDRLVTKVIPDPVMYKPEDVKPEEADLILQHIFPNTLELDDAWIYQVEHSYPYPAMGHVQVVSDELIEKKPDSKTAKRYGPSNRTLNTQASSNPAALSTGIRRYLSKTRNLPQNKLKAATNEMRTAFYNAVKKSRFVVKPELLTACVAASVKKFEENGHSIPDDVSLLALEDYVKAGKLTFSLKQQQKATCTGDPSLKRKAGQGISAWDKSINFKFVVWTRAMEQALRSCTRPGYHFMNGLPEDETIHLLDAGCAGANVFAANDFAEFDASQNNLELSFNMSIMRDFGVPPDVVEFYGLYRTEWVQIKHGLMKLHGHNKKHSGEPATLLFNTTFNMAVTLQLMKPTGLTFAGFKGDDSIVAAKDVWIDHRLADQLKHDAGYVCKLERNTTAKFVGYIMSKQGAALDIPRLATKVLSRLHRTPARYEEYKDAVKDWLHAARREETVMRMLQVNSNHYGLTPEMCGMLFSVVKNFTNTQWETLPTVNAWTRETTHLGPDGATIKPPALRMVRARVSPPPTYSASQFDALAGEQRDDPPPFHDTETRPRLPLAPGFRPLAEQTLGAETQALINELTSFVPAEAGFVEPPTHEYLERRRRAYANSDDSSLHSSQYSSPTVEAVRVDWTESVSSHGTLRHIAGTPVQAFHINSMPDDTKWTYRGITLSVHKANLTNFPLEEPDATVVVNAANEFLGDGGGWCRAFFRRFVFPDITHRNFRASQTAKPTGHLEFMISTKVHNLLQAVGPKFVEDCGRDFGKARQMLATLYVDIYRTLYPHIKHLVLPLLSSDLYGVPTTISLQGLVMAIEHTLPTVHTHVLTIKDDQYREIITDLANRGFIPDRNA